MFNQIVNKNIDNLNNRLSGLCRGGICFLHGFAEEFR